MGGAFLIFSIFRLLAGSYLTSVILLVPVLISAIFYYSFSTSIVEVEIDEDEIFIKGRNSVGW
jgi:hypothetical protein